MSADSKTKQLQKETLEYGKDRVAESPFHKYLEDHNLTVKDLDDQYNLCMQGR